MAFGQQSQRPRYGAAPMPQARPFTNRAPTGGGGGGGGGMPTGGRTTSGTPTFNVPGRGSSFRGISQPSGPPPPPGPVADKPLDPGTESGPGILEQWFNMRASGTDPAYEYALKRGGDEVDSRMAAAGSFNSGARGQQQSDFAANMAAQRMAQLDALAGGASGEHMGRLNAMFNQGLGLAGGQAGTMGAYDLASANSADEFMKAILEMMGGKAGADDRSNQRGLNNLFGLGSLFK